MIETIVFLGIILIALPLIFGGAIFLVLCLEKNRRKNDGVMVKKILDPCCSGRMFWFDKKNPLCLFGNIREVKECITGKGKNARKYKCKPDKIIDFRDMKDIKSNTFYLIVFDPPHMFLGKTSYMAMKYGSLNKETWQGDIKKGFSECFRVLRQNGILIFKWNEFNISLKDILKLCEYKPLFGHPSGKAQRTHWVSFMKDKSLKKEQS